MPPPTTLEVMFPSLSSHAESPGSTQTELTAMVVSAAPFSVIVGGVMSNTVSVAQFETSDATEFVTVTL